MPAACGDSSLQLSIYANGRQAIYAFIKVQNIKPRPLPSPKLGSMPIMVAALTSVFCTIAAHVPYSSLSSKNTGTEDSCKSTIV
jgi:hypothetical protein